MEKTEAREHAKSEWREFLKIQKNLSSVNERLAGELKALSSESSIFIYRALPDEADLEEALRSVENQIYLPAITGPHAMEFRLYREGGKEISSLEKGPHGISQPPDDVPKALLFRKEDLAVIPSLGASVFGKRLGRGGGFYDRWAENAGLIRKISILPESLSAMNFPEETHDLGLNRVITENGLVDYI